MENQKRITPEEIAEVAAAAGYTFKRLNAFVKVESGGVGFKDGKLVIQFEPSWFKRKKSDWKKDTKNVFWQANGVENQAQEWKAFNSAFASNPDAAMQSTSIGLMQVMGFHFKSLGFKTVGEMWDFAKVSERNQLELAIRFIKNIPALDRAIKTGNAKVAAYYYNGEQYAKYNYDTRLIEAGF